MLWVMGVKLMLFAFAMCALPYAVFEVFAPNETMGHGANGDRKFFFY